MNKLNLIELKNVSFEYENNNEIIKNINIAIKRKEITCIIGPNGSGKTTLGKLMVGILKPTKGKIYIDNKDIKDMNLGQIGGKIGYLFQNPEKHFFSNTVEDEIRFPLEMKGLDREYIDDKVQEMINRFYLEDLKNSFPLKISQGQKQNVAMAAILANGPEYLILDEPTKGLDIERKKTLVEILKDLHNQGIGMTIISHDDKFVDEISNRVLSLYRGEIIDDRQKY